MATETLLQNWQNWKMRPSRVGRWKYIDLAGAGVTASLALLGGAAMLFLLDPAASNLFPPCPFHFATGLLCPGCGTLRASHHLLHGEFQIAWGLNPLFVASTPILFAQLAWPKLLRSRYSGWVAFAAVLLFGIGRNLV